MATLIGIIINMAKSNMKSMKKLRIYLLLMVSFFCVSSLWAQKKEIAAAKDQVKAGKNLEQAQANMQKLLNDSVNRRNLKIWLVLYDAVRKQYEQGNEKLYLKQAYDTAQLFSLTRQLFIVAQKMDSVEMIPDSKGKVHVEFRKAHGEYLDQIRPNLYNGGIWFVRKQKYEDAYKCFDEYIHCASLPLFANYTYQQNDKRIPNAAYWAVYCGYKMKNPKATLHHSYEALKDTAHYDYMLQYLAETYKLERDTARYEQTLREGFEHSPKFPFFFPRLVEYYVHKEQLDSAMEVVDKALEIDAKNETYLFSKSTILLNQGKNKESVAISKQLIAMNDSMPEIYYNAGLAYFNMAVAMDKNTQVSKKRHDEIVSLYKKALPYMVRYREMQPNEQEKWALPLYTIYLNLNMGNEFDEIDRLMRNTNKK